MARTRARSALSPSEVKAHIETYLSSRKRDDRYASFDFCFNYFQAQREKGLAGRLADDGTSEIACLQLGFYLASWGMYRGSTELLKRSLAYLEPAVQVVATSPPEIWSCDADDYSEGRSDLILDVGERLRAAFPKGATDTLVTKIMLGVFGCVPAFDTYFKQSFGTWSFDRSALERIAEFYALNAGAIEKHRIPTLDFATGSDTKRRYTRAKVIDMVFFTAGYG